MKGIHVKELSHARRNQEDGGVLLRVDDKHRANAGDVKKAVRLANVRRAFRRRDGTHVKGMPLASTLVLSRAAGKAVAKECSTSAVETPRLETSSKRTVEHVVLGRDRAVSVADDREFDRAGHRARQTDEGQLGERAVAVGFRTHTCEISSMSLVQASCDLMSLAERPMTARRRRTGPIVSLSRSTSKVRKALDEGDAGRDDVPLTLRFSNSGMSLATSPSSVVQT
jgi:hypothetical protein